MAPSPDTEAPLAAAAAATPDSNMLPSFPHLTLLLRLPHLLTAPPCLRLWKKAALALVTALEVALPPAAQSPDNRVCRRLRQRRAKGNQRFLRQVSASQLQKHRSLCQSFEDFPLKNLHNLAGSKTYAKQLLIS